MGSSNSSDSSSSNSLSNSFGELVGGVVGIAYYLLKGKMDLGWADTIRSKLRKEMDKNSDLERQIQEKYKVSLDEFAVALGDEELFKKTFLLPYYQPHKILEEVEKELEQVKMFNDMGCPMTETELKEAIKRINDRKSKLSEHKFELILTECQASKINNVLFKSFVNSYYEFGALHSALSLDGTIIEWGRGPCGDSLICPTMDISQFLFAFEVKAKEDESFFTMIGNKIKEAVTSVLDFFLRGCFWKMVSGQSKRKKARSNCKNLCNV